MADPFAEYIVPDKKNEKDEDPFASHLAPEPAAVAAPVEPEAPAAPKGFTDQLSDQIKSLTLPTSWSDVKARVSQNLPELGRQVAQPFKDIAGNLASANDAATRLLFHPVSTLGGGRAVPAIRETMRGVNSNIPFANSAVEALGGLLDGPPAVSAQDAAAAPGFQALGGMLGTPAAGAVGGIIAKPIEAAVPVLGRALGGLTKEAAEERQVTRAVEDLGSRVRKAKTRAGIESDSVETLVREHPEIRAAAGNDAKVSETIGAAKKDAQETLATIYKSAPQELSPSNAIANMDARIAELTKGTSEDRAVARSLKAIRDEFEEAHGAKSGITPMEMRAEQTAYQKQSYGKALPGDMDASARIKANAEASKSVGDAVVRHVTGMDYAEAKAAAEKDPGGLAAKLFKANDTVNAVNKIEAGVTERASRVQPREGIVGKAQHLSHVLRHPTESIPAAVDATVRAADARLSTGGISQDGMLARIARAAAQGNLFAQRQLRLVAASPAGAARLAAIQAQDQAQAASP